MATKRRIFEPRDRFDRLVYTLLALFGPYTAIVAFRHPDLKFASIVFVALSVIAAFYTIEWAILSYRAWHNGPVTK